MRHRLCLCVTHVQQRYKQVKVLLAGDDAERADEVARTLATSPTLTAAHTRAQAVIGHANALPDQASPPEPTVRPKRLPAMTGIRPVAIEFIITKQRDVG